jgi:release factor glutamine methyltransferase
MYAPDVRVAKNWDLHALLPDTLPAEQILAAYDLTPASPGSRAYRWNGWDFELSPGVFEPGEGSRLLHDRLLDGTLPLAGLRYAAMGVGLGVEAVVAGVRGASTVHALDVHEESVRTTARHYARIVGDGGPPFVGVVSDLWQDLPDDARFDVVTFNPPLIDVRLSEDPDVVRNRCMGVGLALRFFDQIASRRLLAPGGVVYLTLASTEPLREVVAMALHAGFDVEALHVSDRPAGSGRSVRTYLLALSAGSGPTCRPRTEHAHAR